MALDIERVGSPAWWFVRLVTRLQDERKDVERLEQLYRGNHPLPEGAEGMAEAYRQFQRLCRSNYLSLVVEAPLERMRVVGFRAGGSEDEVGDDKTWEMWQSAHLDADQVMVHRTMLALRRAYVIVGPHPRKRGEVLITPEHPSQVFVEHFPDDRRTPRAAVKSFTDDVSGKARATVYLPNGIFKYESPNKPLGYMDEQFYMPDNLRHWTLVDAVANPLGEIPVVEFANRPTLLGGAIGEFEDVIDIQNRINTTLLHRLVSEKFGAFRQKAVLNLEFEEDANGDPIVPVLPNDPAMAWLLQGENLRLHEFSQNDTAQIINAVTTDIRDLAAITRTPPHYLLGGIVNSSGDALKAAETGLVAKVRERQSQAGEAWEVVMHLAHLVKGDQARANVVDMEAIWADPEARTLGELADSALKKKQIGIPFRQLAQDLGYSPQVVKRMESERVADAMLEQMLAPPPATGAQSPATGSGDTRRDTGTPAAAP